MALELLRIQLADWPGFELEHAERLSAGVQRLERGDVDVVLLDLDLPDSRGLDTFTKLRNQAAAVPIVVLTSMDDEDQAAKAVQLGAQDYLIKGQVESELLGRSLRYAIERQRLLRELEETRQREQYERELSSLERAGASSDSPTTADVFGQAPLGKSSPVPFGELVQWYAGLIDLAVEQRTFKVEHDLHGRVRQLAERLGFLKAVPRDLVEIHSAAIKDRAASLPDQKAQACREEAQFILLELMGHLCTFYRKYATGVMAGHSPHRSSGAGGDASAKDSANG